MKIVKADTLGYCMGVRRAVESADVALNEYKEKKVYSLGPLIHNQIALDELKSKGLITTSERDINLIEENSVVIIRAHGVSPKVKNLLQEKNVSIVDSTCPRVTVSQNRVAEFSKKGYTIILAGDKGHAEVEGICGYATTCFYCVENFEEAKLIIENKISVDEKCLLLSQTTFSLNEFLRIADFAKSKIKNLEVINTICPATKKRQEALERLCKIVDGIIVVGGKKSANTIRLYQKAKSLLESENLSCKIQFNQENQNKPIEQQIQQVQQNKENSLQNQVQQKCAIHIEKSSEIPQFFKNFKTVGITAGASTPDNVIEEVVDALNKM